MLAFPEDQKMTKIPELQVLIISFCLEGQKAKFRLPTCDLNVVLWCLRVPPFQPLHATLIFLLALATGARVSELNALGITHEH